MGRQPRTDGQVDAHDAIGGPAGNVDDFVVVEHRHRARFVQRVRHLFHEGLDHARDVEGGEVGEAEIEQPRCEAESIGVLYNVAEGLESLQVTPGGRPGEACSLGDVGDGEPWALRRKRPDNRQTTFKSLDVLTGAGLAVFSLP